MWQVTKRFAIAISVATALSCAAPARAPAPRVLAASKLAPVTPSTADAPVPNVAEARVASQGLTYVFRASRFSNLLYELDCLAGVSRCSKVAFTELWKARLGDKEGDVEALKAWHALRYRYSGRILRNDEEETSPLPLPSPSRSIEMRVRLAGYGAVDEQTYLSRLALFVDPSDLDVARSAIDRFTERFDRYWAERQPDLARGLTEYAALLARADVAAVLESARLFFEPQVSSGATETFDLIARPDHDSADSGEQLVDHSLIEVRPNEHATKRFGVVMHELFHAWFAASPHAKQKRLVEAFASSTDPFAIPAYGLLNEVLATDFGNGLVERVVDPKELERRLAKPRGMYNDDAIDAVAKSMLPVLGSMVAAKTTVFDPDFVSKYLSCVDATFPQGVPPILYLRPFLLAFDPGLERSSDRLEEAVRSSSVRSTSTLDPHDVLPLFVDNRMWGGAVLVPTAKLDSLKEWKGVVDPKTMRALRREAGKHEPFVWMTHRPKGGAFFVFVADDEDAMSALVEHFAKLTVFREGVAAH